MKMTVRTVERKRPPEKAQPGGLYHNPNTGIVYMLFVADSAFLAVAPKTGTSWRSAKSTPEEAVRGLDPFYGRVEIISEMEVGDEVQ